MTETENKKILIVDKDLESSAKEKRILEKHGYTVTIACTGKEALALITSGRTPHLVIIDIELDPEMDGSETARQILKETKLPILFICDYKKRSMLEKVTEIQSYGTVIKDTEESILNNLVKAALRNSEERLRTILGAIPDLIFVLTEAGVFTDFCVSDQENLYVPPDKFLGKKVHDVFPMITAAGLSDLIKKTLSTGNIHTWNYELTIQEKIMYYEARMAPYGGNKVLAIIRDVTKQKEAEFALQQKHTLAKAMEQATFSLTTTLDTNRVLDRILEQIFRIIPSDAANIMLIQNEKKVKVVRTRGYERFATEDSISSFIFDIDSLYGLAYMLRKRETLIIGDIQSEASWVNLENLDWVRSYLGAPIQVRGEVVGFINMDSAVKNFFTSEHAEALKGFASHAAAALENARLYESEQERRHVAEILRQTSENFNSTLEIGKLLELILAQLREVIHYDSASVQERIVNTNSDSVDDYLKIVSCGGFRQPEKVLGLVFPLDKKFPNYRVITSKEALAIRDIVIDYPHFNEEADTYESGLIRSWLGVPLIVRQKIIGMIAVDRESVDPFSQEEIELTFAFANQAAIAADNARLYRETRKLADFNRNIIQRTSEGIVLEDVEGNITFANPAAARMVGYSIEEIVGLKSSLLIHPDKTDLLESVNNMRKQGISHSYEMELLHKNGTRLQVLVSGNPRYDTNGQFIGSMAVFTDITDIKKTEQQLIKTVEEKEFLMREMNHRIKNNLLILSSIIKIKEAELGNGVDLSELNNQINTIRLLHDKLHKGEHLSSICIHDYLQDVLETVFSSVLNLKVDIENKIEDITLDAKTAVTLGMLINEIATNAIKYGFKSGQRAKFSVKMKTKKVRGEYILKLSNSGNPLPENIDFSRKKSFGFQLITALVDQLGGTINSKRTPQAEYIISFPVMSGS